MRNTIITVLVVAVIALLYFTNPGKEAFAARFADEINTDLSQELGLEGTLGNLLGGAAQSLIQDALESQICHDNYLLASVFTVPTAGDDVRVLGVAGQFISLN